MLSSDRSKNVVIAAALLAAVGLLAVRRLPRLVFERATYSDGASVYRDVDTLRHAVWSPPEHLGPQVNSPARESRPATSPDGRWLVWALGEPGLACDLWIAPLTAELIQWRIDEKASRISSYRAAMLELWLVIGVLGRDPSQFFDFDTGDLAGVFESPFDRTYFVDGFLGRALLLRTAHDA